MSKLKLVHIGVGSLSIVAAVFASLYTISSVRLEQDVRAASLKEVGFAQGELSEDIRSGKHFTVRFNGLPNGHFGTIYNGRLLVGVFDRARHAWKVCGPNGPAGRPHCEEYCPSGCGSGNPAIDPVGDHLIELWGAQFSFDDDGKVFLKGSRSEVGQVVIGEPPNICDNRQERLVPIGGTQCITHDVYTCTPNGVWKKTRDNACGN